MKRKSRFLYIEKSANEGKIASIEALHTEYLRYLQSCICAMIDAHVFSVSLNDFQSFFPAEKTLSSNIVNQCQQHAVAIVSGWAATAYTIKVKNAISRLAKEGSLSDEGRKALYTIGKLSVSKPTETIRREDLDLYWSLLLAASRPPTASRRVGIQVSYLTAVLSTSKKAKHTDWWLALSHLNKGHRLQLPLSANPYVTDSAVLSKGGLLRKDKRGRWRIEFIERKEQPKLVPGKNAPRISVDVGLNVLAAVTGGRLYGRDVKPKFDRMYAELQKLRANRQRQGLRENSPRLDRMEERLTGFVKTSTGEIANKIVKSFPDHAVVVEDLDLKGCRGQKRFAYRALQKSLEGKIATISVNPAYTSQECPSCGYVSRANRNGTKFFCRSCGRRSHADAVGEINLLGRSEDKQIGLADGPRTVNRYLRERYRLRRNSTSRSEFAPARSGPRLTTKGTEMSGLGTASNISGVQPWTLGIKPCR